MNKSRRASIQIIINQLEEINGQIADIEQEEQEAFDNLPEGIQCSDKGEAMSTAAENLSDASSAIDDIISPLESAQE